MKSPVIQPITKWIHESMWFQHAAVDTLHMLTMCLTMTNQQVFF